MKTNLKVGSLFIMLIQELKEELSPILNGSMKKKIL